MLLVHSYTFVLCFVITVTKKYTNTTAVIFESAPLCFTPHKLYSVYLSCINAISYSRCINKLHGFSKKNNQSKYNPQEGEEGNFRSHDNLYGS